MSEQNVELALGCYEAVNRRDVQWIVDHSTPDIEFQPHPQFAAPDLQETYRGREGLEAFRTHWIDAWSTSVAPARAVDPPPRRV
jgi:hypothetical protein